MSSKIYMLESGNVNSDITTGQTKIATGTSLKTLLQFAPNQGVEIIQWGIAFDGSAAATPGIVELVEVDVAASGGTASYVPIAPLSTAIAASTTTSLVICSAIQPTANTFQVGSLGFGTLGQPGSGEQMQVTAGGSGTTLTVVRGVNGTVNYATMAASSTYIYALPGTGVISDVQPVSGVPFGDPGHVLTANGGAALTGFGMSTYNSPRNIRKGDTQLLPPTAPYVLQFPLERGFEVNPGRFVQIRVTFGTTINASCYLIFQA